jgi:hypothetical protein
MPAPIKPTQWDKDMLLLIARTMIWDMTKGWPMKELEHTPEELCQAITEALGDNFDFATGEVKDK